MVTIVTFGKNGAKINRACILCIKYLRKSLSAIFLSLGLFDFKSESRKQIETLRYLLSLNRDHAPLSAALSELL